MNGEKVRKHAQRNLQPWRFFKSHGRETGIVEGGGARSFGDRAMQRSNGQSIADAASQLTMRFKMQFALRIAIKPVVQIAMQMAAHISVPSAPQVKRGEDAARLR